MNLIAAPTVATAILLTCAVAADGAAMRQEQPGSATRRALCERLRVEKDSEETPSVLPHFEALCAGRAAVRETAVQDLAEADDPHAVLVTLQRALDDPSPRVREAVIEALGGIGNDEAAWALAPALRDASPDLRETALHVLAEIGTDVSLTVLEQALGDASERIRRLAADLLEERRPEAPE